MLWFAFCHWTSDQWNDGHFAFFHWKGAASCVDYVPQPAFLLDEMSTRIDDLEKNIADLMTQAGVEEIEGTPEKAKEGQGS